MRKCEILKIRGLSFHLVYVNRGQKDGAVAAGTRAAQARKSLGELPTVAGDSDLGRGPSSLCWRLGQEALWRAGVPVPATPSQV